MNWAQKAFQALRLGLKRWRRRNAVFISFGGPPGSGKGTQATLLGETGWEILGVGEALRAQAHKKTALGLEAAPYLDAGTLVPTPVAMAIIAAELEDSRFDAGGGLDGAPRRKASLFLIDEKLATWGCEIDLFICFDASDEVVMERLSLRRMCSNENCSRHRKPYHLKFDAPISALVDDGRPLCCDLCGSSLETRDDDKPETIADRLVVYRSESEPLKEIFEARQRLCVITVDNEITAKEVFEKVLAAVQKAAAARKTRPRKGLKFYLGLE